jgi:hypothetical protein
LAAIYGHHGVIDYDVSVILIGLEIQPTTLSADYRYDADDCFYL